MLETRLLEGETLRSGVVFKMLLLELVDVCELDT